MREPADTTTVVPPCRPSSDGGCRLHTATLSLRHGDGWLEVFHACRVGSTGEVVARLAARLGPTLAVAAVVRTGIDPHHRVVAALLGAEAARHLADHGDLPGGALLDGGDLHVLQRRD